MLASRSRDTVRGSEDCGEQPLDDVNHSEQDDEDGGSSGPSGQLPLVLQNPARCAAVYAASTIVTARWIHALPAGDFAQAYNASSFFIGPPTASGC